MHGHDRIRKLFTEGFRALDIARALPSFDLERDASDVGKILAATGGEVAGVRTAGLVNGYVLREELERGSCGDHLRPFASGQVLDENAGLQSSLEVLADHAYCFVATLGTVDAIVTRSDVDKPPARMWLFGVITMIEMNMVEMIAQRFSEESWRELMPRGRLRMAEDLLSERRRRGQHVSLLDCLQLGDKAQILLHDRRTIEEANFPSVRAAKRALKELGSLRNSLAHAQDIVTYDWSAVTMVARRLHLVLTRNSRGDIDDDLVQRARRFAVEAHRKVDHRRKYTNEPYEVHLKAVADMVREVSDDADVQAAAWLHDVVEDTEVTLEQVERDFGARVAGLVADLTDVSRSTDGNRESRKALDREHSSRADPAAKTVKLADMIDNVRSIAEHSPRFARVYVDEKERLLPLLAEGHADLLDRARKTLGEARARFERGLG